MLECFSSSLCCHLGLAADDANTVRYGMSGLDATAGTADDYTIRLALVEDCFSADVEVSFSALGPPSPAGQTLGGCEAQLTAIDPTPPPAGAIHHAMQRIFPLFDRIRVRINSEVVWDSIFADGFESSDTAAWQ